ncbi:hypothetical protein T4A_1356 [Trichinella pseudospiralis]|uniref:Uncharacterized protein n=1 Tax=Trichinella pseudospiralis TaxID=6337 RepID=A0A0V1EUM5_TRIPS|nr:hypothetical protein T4A_1356 [Trichinella pseudospiralis]
MYGRMKTKVVLRKHERVFVIADLAVVIGSRKEYTVPGRGHGRTRERLLLVGHAPSVVGGLNGLQIPLLLDSEVIVFLVPLPIWQKSTCGEHMVAAIGSIPVVDYHL